MRKLLPLLLAGALAAACSTPPDPGMEAYEQGDYVGAFGIWQERLASGDDVAQYGLARLYAEGKGVDRNDSEAVRLCRLSAEAGNADAQTLLGGFYARGQGVDMSLEEAAVWFRKAAWQDHATAQNNLGVLYARGQGVPPDPAEAICGPSTGTTTLTLTIAITGAAPPSSTNWL